MEMLISFFVFNGICSGFWCWKLWQKSLIPLGITVTRGRGPNKSLPGLSLLSKQLYSFISFKMQCLGKILLNIARTGSFIYFVERGLMEGFWEDLSQVLGLQFLEG